MHDHRPLPKIRYGWLSLALGLAVAGAAWLVYLFPPEQSAFYPRCLLNAVTGLQCPGCGGLRAAHHLLHGEIQTAFALNPLVVLAGPITLLAVSLHGWARKSRLARWVLSLKIFWMGLLVGGIILFGIGRNIFTIWIE